MKKLIRSIAVATIALGIFLGAVGAVEEEYEGASYCREYPAWPGGTYLGQMHPYHSSFYTGYAERRGWNACETWANDQRRSAVRGLRELGYTVLDPAATSDPTPVAADPNLGLSRDTAAPIGTPVRGSLWEVTVLSVTPNATAAVLAENQFNDPPESGHQFFVVRIKVLRIAPDSDSFSAGLGLRAVGDEGVAYSTFGNSCGVIPDEYPSSTEIFSGGSIEGNECWQIRQADAGSLKMFIGSGEGRRWFNLH